MPRIPNQLCEIHSLGPATGEWLVGARQVPAFRTTRTIVAGHSEARRGYAFVRHAPGFSQLLACTGGEGEVLIDGRWQPCTPGLAYVTASRTLCAYHVRPGRSWKVCWVLYEEAARLPGLAPGQPPRLLRLDAEGLHLAIAGLCHEANGLADPTSLDFWAALVHQQVLRSLQSENTASRLHPLWSALRRDLAGDWTLTRMARCAGLSQESLRRLSWRQVGRSPLAHLTHLRMLLAADLLACTQEKIAAIAARTGYADAFAFSTAFKRALGQPPSRYRAAHLLARSAPTPQPSTSTPAPSPAVNRK